MRKLIIIPVAMLFCFSCKERAATKHEAATAPDPSAVEGLYAGTFKGAPISIILNYITEKRASGYNIHKGLKRNLSGTLSAAIAGWHLVLNEPGTNEYDGIT